MSVTSRVALSPIDTQVVLVGHHQVVKAATGQLLINFRPVIIQIVTEAGKPKPRPIDAPSLPLTRFDYTLRRRYCSASFRYIWSVCERNLIRSALELAQLAKFECLFVELFNFAYCTPTNAPKRVELPIQGVQAC